MYLSDCQGAFVNFFFAYYKMKNAHKALIALIVLIIVVGVPLAIVYRKKKSSSEGFASCPVVDRQTEVSTCYNQWVYGSNSDCQAQCGNCSSKIKLVTDSSSGGKINPCTMPRGSPVYVGCGYGYFDQNSFNQQCGSRNLQYVGKWIGDSIQTPGSLNQCWADFLCNKPYHQAEGQICQGDGTTVQNGWPAVTNGRCVKQ